ncbi:MAG TPA: Flp family type IVb pilin [Chloroflexota bacterium]
MRSRRSQRTLAQSMVEYAIVAALVAVFAIVAIRALGTTVAGVFDNITSSVQTVSPGNNGGHP